MFGTDTYPASSSSSFTYGDLDGSTSAGPSSSTSAPAETLQDSYTQALQAQARAAFKPSSMLYEGLQGVNGLGAGVGGGGGSGSGSGAGGGMRVDMGTGSVGGQGMNGVGVGVGAGPGVGVGLQQQQQQQQQQLNHLLSINPPSFPAATVPRPNPSPSVPPSRATSLGLDNITSNASSIQDRPISRSEPPKRLIEVDGLPLTVVSPDDLKTQPERTRLLLQGDPQIINKQRVETAIRVILDILRAVPRGPGTSPLVPALYHYLPADPTLTNISFERVDSFHGLRLQTGTTTKTVAKKQLQSGRTPVNELLYLETAVYISGDNGRRVYACKRCRLREQRRRANKDAARKKQTSSGSDSSPAQIPESSVPPSPDHITGANPDQYDPHSKTQVVEEPPWDPDRADWRHEIVLFNSAPEVPIKDASCMWLPFRVICYGKCHGEKVGFKIKFSLRTHDGTVIATSFTDPIRITDDHKTDTKVRIKDQPAVPRRRKGRASAASSRRQSPAPSESESVQSWSEAGAMMQKQTPNVRGNKPYDRPSQSPALGTGSLPYDDRPRFARQPSSNSLHSGGSMTNLPIPSEMETPPITNTVSPGALRRPNFGFTALDGSLGPASASSSNVASPVAGLRPLADDMLMMHDSLNAQSLGFDIPGGQSMLSDFLAQQDQDMANNLSSAMDGLFDASSRHSLASSFDAASSFSGFRDSASGYYSDSGLVPEDTSMEGFLDFSGGEDQNLAQPAFGSPQGLPMPFNIDLGGSPNGYGAYQMSSPGQDTQAQIQDLLSSFSQRDPSLSPTSLLNAQSPPAPMGHPAAVSGQMMGQSQLQSQMAPQGQNLPAHVQQQQQSQPQQHMAPPTQLPQQIPMPMAMPNPMLTIPPQPTVSHVIPAEGPMAGGTQVAVAGQRFAPGMTVMFGQRVAKTTVISDSFCTCELPPAAEPGLVEVAVQGAVRRVGERVETFRYLGMDREMMRLALEVREQYQGSSSDAAYRLAQRIAQNSYSSESDRSSASPMSGPSPGGFLSLAEQKESVDGTATPAAADEDDLQLTIINFLASIDAHAPGSLRRSGAVNHRNKAQQTLLHIATTMGFHRLVRRLVVIGAQLDLQDVNGFTPLAFASLCGQVACARVLIEAGAAYDRPTAFGEMPLDLARGEQEVEKLLLSAVWSTTAPAQPDKEKEKGKDAERSRLPRTEATETRSEIDNDNPSSGSEVDEEAQRLKNARVRRRRSKGKQRAEEISLPPSPTARTRRSPSAVESELDVEVDSGQPDRREVDERRDLRAELELQLQLDAELDAESDITPQPTPVPSVAHSEVSTPSPPAEAPPPYTPPLREEADQETDEAEGGSWMSRTLSGLSHSSAPHLLPDAVWSRLPLPSWPDKSTGGAGTSNQRRKTTASETQGGTSGHGWIALPAPTWETLSRLTSPEEVKLLTQAMAAAALSAVMQSTGGYEFGVGAMGMGMGGSGGAAAAAAMRKRRGRGKGRREGGSGHASATGSATGSGIGSASGSASPDPGSVRRGSVDGEGAGAGVKSVKQDRMLYLFWLPILLFVGFWLVVSALPIATGFCLIYARQITRAIKQRM